MKWIWLAMVSVLLAGCSTFHKEWQAATQSPAPATGIEGAWEGEWSSEQNGHHGSLKCVVSKASETAYRAHFRAKFLKVFRYTYLATLNGTETNGVVRLKGEADLGKIAGGVYSYEGTASAAGFRSTYSSKHDHGKYEMTRLPVMLSPK